MSNVVYKKFKEKNNGETYLYIPGMEEDGCRVEKANLLFDIALEKFKKSLKNKP